MWESIFSYKVYKPGTKVTLEIAKYQGIITGVLIGDGISYRISYVENGAYKESYFYEIEFLVEKVEYEQIGFKEG
jgi:hypothetical protein